MLSWLLVAVTLVQAEPTATWPAGPTLLSYRGSVAPLDPMGEVAEPLKRFDLSLLLTPAGDRAVRVDWIVEEAGAGAWAWPEQFGTATIPADSEAMEGPEIALLFDRGEKGHSVVTFRLPLGLNLGQTAAGATWQDGDASYEVRSRETRWERETWKVEARNGYGHQRTLWIADAAPTLVAIQQRLFMGMGEEHRLEAQLTESRPLQPGETAATLALLDDLNQWRAKSRRPERTVTARLSKGQIASAAQLADGLDAAGAVGAVARFVARVKKDVRGERTRRGDAESFAGKRMQQAIEPFRLEALSGDPLHLKDLKDGITVLHFWKYNDHPLEEPYGQVGYLDFLYQHRREEGVRVVGVAVNPQLAQPDRRAGALRSVRRLKSFMNLSYPVYLDHGAVLKQFGDPRSIGESLPLFVVLGPEGRIRHFHIGPYEVDRDRGLAELDAAVAKLLSESKQ